MSEKKLLVVGCGLVGARMVQPATAAGWQVLGVTKTEDSADFLRKKLPAANFFAADVAEAVQVKKLYEYYKSECVVGGGGVEMDALIFCASSGGRENYRRVFVEGLQKSIAAFMPRKIVFTSSTSVYAQRDGSWVDETSPTEPTTETGKILLEAEKIVLDQGGTVARLAGIYASERWHTLRKFKLGRANIDMSGGLTGGRWVNSIHAQDAATALLSILKNGDPGIYNVTDGTPYQQEEIYTKMVEMYGGELPQKKAADTNRNRGWSHKRASNKKLCKLGWQPHHSSLIASMQAGFCNCD